MKPEIKVFPTPNDVARAFAQMILEKSQQTDRFNIALSGGSTPKLLFDILASDYKDKIEWNKIHFYWGDERCVPPGDPDSNYLMTKNHLFDHIDINEANIHRVFGEDNPDSEAKRYAQLLHEQIPASNELPQFDLIMLGLGEDGHTASIFPHQMELLDSDKVCEVAHHPVTGQQRISLTGKVINNAKEVAFLVTGEGKKEKVKSILEHAEGYQQFPAAHIQPRSGQLTWWMDEAASNPGENSESAS